MADSIKMQFRTMTQIGQRNHVPRGGVDPPGKGQLWADVSTT